MSNVLWFFDTRMKQLSMRQAVSPTISLNTLTCLFMLRLQSSLMSKIGVRYLVNCYMKVLICTLTLY